MTNSIRLSGWHQKDNHGLEVVADVSEDMRQAIAYMAQLTEVVDMFYQDPKSKALTGFLVLGRNEVQHFLLSFYTSQYDVNAFIVDNKGSSTLDDVQSLALTEIIRVAASIYSDMLFFPLPWSTGVKLRLAGRMRLIWSKSQMDQPAEPAKSLYTDLHVWVLWLGCFAAFRSQHQQWFEMKLYHVLETFYGIEWESATYDMLKQALRSFLWFDPVCDTPGRDLWTRIVSRVRDGVSNI